MLYCALVFLLVSVMVGTMNTAGASTVAVQTSWIMELVGSSGRDASSFELCGHRPMFSKDPRFHRRTNIFVLEG